MDVFQEKIELAIGEQFKNKENLLDLMAQYHLAGGGKRIRGRLALVHANELAIPFSDAMNWAVACELLHNATLVHDDIQDDDQLRRGRPSIWAKFGINQAINLGDYLIFSAYQMVGAIEVKRSIPSLISCLSQKAKDVVRGQALEIHSAKQSEGNYWQNFIRVAELKTGALLQAPLEGIHILSGESPEQAAAGTAGWLKLGLIYQINDDINDYLGRKQDHQRYKDFFEQKINSLVAWLSLDEQQQGLISDYLQCEKNSPQHLQIIKQLCHQINKKSILADLTHIKTKFFQQFQGASHSQASKIIADYIAGPAAEEKENVHTI